MNRRLVLVAVASGLLVVLAAYCGVRSRDAQARAAAAVRALRSAREEAATLAALRAAAAPQGTATDRDMLAVVREVASDAGLPEGAVREIAPEAESTGAGTAAVRRRGVRVVLGDIGPRDLGAFLAAWSRVAPGWRLTSAQLDHRGSPGPDPVRGYTARLAFGAAVPMEGTP